MLNKLERKFSKYAISNLSLILIITYGVGYLLGMLAPSLLTYLSLNPYEILHGQIWRLITWVLIPPSSFDILVLVTLYFYYSIGKTLERIWGDWLYNVYIFSGLIFTVIASFILYAFIYYVGLKNGLSGEMLDVYLKTSMQAVGLMYFSTYYINMSIFLAFAATLPDAGVLLMFLIPVKMKWLGIIYGVMIVYEFITGNIFLRVAILASLLNFIVFFFMQRKRLKGSPIQRVKQAKRRHEFNKEVHSTMKPAGVSKHKCAICGQTEIDAPDLQFRFCSKCNGNYEYCEKHLFTHTHIE